MTPQDLKNSRNKIISRINEIADTAKMAEIMKAMLNLVEGEMNEAIEPVALVDEVVSLLGYERKYTGKHMDDLMVEAAKRQMPSSMR